MLDNNFAEFALQNKQANYQVKEVRFTQFDTKAKYYKVPSTISEASLAELVDQLLFTCWDLQKPNLIISVAGGKEAFKVSKHLSRTFRQSIVRASQSARAWILTGGLNCGVMRHVGKAVRDYAIYLSDEAEASEENRRADAVCLGVATWGVVQDRWLLQTKEPIVNYEVQKRVEQGAYLNPNHSHFLLVDDGSVMEYHKEVEFRSRLERIIADSKFSFPRFQKQLWEDSKNKISLRES